MTGDMLKDVSTNAFPTVSIKKLRIIPVKPPKNDSTMATRRVTLRTPMIMPSIVRNEHSLVERIEETAIYTV